LLPPLLQSLQALQAVFIEAPCSQLQVRYGKSAAVDGALSELAHLGGNLCSFALFPAALSAFALAVESVEDLCCLCLVAAAVDAVLRQPALLRFCGSLPFIPKTLLFERRAVVELLPARRSLHLTP